MDNDEIDQGMEAAAALSHFTLKVDNVKHLFSIVSAIYNGKKDSYAMIRANHKGLKVSVENSSKSMCAQCMLKGELFNSFHVEPSRGEATEIRFKVNVAHLLECMAIYGKDSLPVTSMHMSYDESEGKLQLLLEESGITTECTLATADFGSGLGDGEQAAADVYYEDVLRKFDIVGKCVIKSEALHDAVRELAEQPGATVVQFTMGQDASGSNFLQLHTYNTSGGCTVNMPERGSDMFESIGVKGPCNWSYDLKLFEATLRALSHASTTFIRVNSRGVLAMTHKVVSDMGSSMLVQFTVMPNEDMGDDDDNDRDSKRQQQEDEGEAQLEAGAGGDGDVDADVRGILREMEAGAGHEGQEGGGGGGSGYANDDDDDGGGGYGYAAGDGGQQQYDDGGNNNDGYIDDNDGRGYGHIDDGGEEGGGAGDGGTSSSAKKRRRYEQAASDAAAADIDTDRYR